MGEGHSSRKREGQSADGTVDDPIREPSKAGVTYSVYGGSGIGVDLAVPTITEERKQWSKKPSSVMLPRCAPLLHHKTYKNNVTDAAGSIHSRQSTREHLYPTSKMIFFKVCLLVTVYARQAVGQGSYYSSFSGPVSGAVNEIVVPESAGFQTSLSEPSFDYVAKPDYSFGYGVNDPVTGNAQKHEESRDGDTVRGQYSVLEPDGSIRTVVYTADPENGFQATVHRKPPSETPLEFAFQTPVENYNPSPASDFTPEYSPEYTPADYTPEYQSDYNPEY